MGIWQYLYLGLTFMGLGMYLAKNGEPKEGTYRFWVRLLAEAFVIFILYKGGFF